jgi:hypothetical protein
MPAAYTSSTGTTATAATTDATTPMTTALWRRVTRDVGGIVTGAVDLVGGVLGTTSISTTADTTAGNLASSTTSSSSSDMPPLQRSMESSWESVGTGTSAMGSSVHASGALTVCEDAGSITVRAGEGVHAVQGVWSKTTGQLASTHFVQTTISHYKFTAVLLNHMMHYRVELHSQ